MAKVRKHNRSLTVSDLEVKRYLAQGYDQVAENGKIIKRATGGKTVSIQQYNQLQDKYEQLEAENERLKKAKKGSKSKKEA